LIRCGTEAGDTDCEDCAKIGLGDTKTTKITSRNARTADTSRIDGLPIEVDDPNVIAEFGKLQELEEAQQYEKGPRRARAVGCQAIRLGGSALPF
jgi:hypothetical protein